MNDLQQYFDQYFNSNNEKIVFQGNKIIKELEGTELIIQERNNLRYLSISDLPKLKTLTIKNCENLESLEIFLDKQIEVKLIGKFLKLEEFNITNTEQQPIIYQKPEKRLCWKCFLFPILVIWNIGLTYWVIKKMKERNKKSG